MSGFHAKVVAERVMTCRHYLPFVLADKLVAGLRVGQLGSAVFFQNEKKKPCFGMPRGTKCVPAAFEKFSKLLKMLALVSSTRAYGAFTNGFGRASLLRSGFSRCACLVPAGARRPEGASSIFSAFCRTFHF